VGQESKNIMVLTSKVLDALRGCIYTMYVRVNDDAVLTYNQNYRDDERNCLLEIDSPVASFNASKQWRTITGIIIPRENVTIVEVRAYKSVNLNSTLARAHAVLGDLLTVV
jgi:hypothetical protein